MDSDEYTINERMLDVGQEHKLYVQLWGNDNAKDTILFLHGGPGSGCSKKHKNNFSPKLQRVIFFDQRGSGKSVPYGSLEDNDTDHLVDDINKILDVYKLDKVSITGGSWGSCLALVFAIRNPQRVTRLVIRGIMMGRQSEIDYLDKGGIRDLFPEVWEKFVSSVPKEFKDKPGSYHQPRVLGDNPIEAKESAFAYSEFEGSLISLDYRPWIEDFETFDPVSTIIETHFVANKCFIPEHYILNNANLLTMPIKLIQGRYDAICPPSTAYELDKVLPNSELFWTIAGHSGNDRENWELTQALLSQ